MGRGVRLHDAFTAVLGDGRGGGQAATDTSDLYFPVLALLDWTCYIVDYTQAFDRAKKDEPLPLGGNLSLDAWWRVYDKTIPLYSNSPEHIQELIQKSDKDVARITRGARGKNSTQVKSFIRGACRGLLLYNVLEPEDYEKLCQPVKHLIALSIVHLKDEHQRLPGSIPEDLPRLNENLKRLGSKTPFGWLPISD